MNSNLNATQFKDESAAYAYVEAWLWPTGPVCPHCGNADAARIRKLAGKSTLACINCHAISGTVANGRFGPDLTHLMTRDTIGAGAALTTHDNLRAWVQNPASLKPGSLMPAMNLTDQQLDALTSYLETLR